MKLNNESPIFLQIKGEIMNQIIMGILKDDSAIPSIRTMAQEYKLNPNTISRAVTELVNDGILYKKRGIGLFVNAGISNKLKREMKINFKTKTLSRCINRANELGIKKIEIINEVEKVYSKET